MRNSGFSIENWTTQLRKGLLELCIVNILSHGEMYGYDLVKRLTSIGGLLISEGTVYPLLSRLHKSGLLNTRLEESSSGPARKYYSLSKEGEKALKLMNAYWGDLADNVESLIKGEDK